MDITKLTPARKHLLVRIPKRVTTTTDAGIILVADSQRNGRYVSAEIIQVGHKVPTDMTIGLCVYIYPQAYTPIHDTPDDMYYVIPYADAIGVCELGVAGDCLDVDALLSQSDVKRMYGDHAKWG